MRKNPEKTSPRKIDPTGDRTWARCVKGTHATWPTAVVIQSITLSTVYSFLKWSFNISSPIGKSTYSFILLASTTTFLRFADISEEETDFSL